METQELFTRAASQLPPLPTPRQDEVLQRLIKGMVVKEIAEDLGITVHVVRDHIYDMCDKFGVRGQMGLVIYALKHGL